MSAELAKKFHDCYEKLAPIFGYETREDTKEFDPLSNNGLLMTAVCAQVTFELRERIAELEAENQRLNSPVQLSEWQELEARIKELEAAALLVVKTSGNWKLENQHADAVLALQALLGGGE